MNAGDDDLATAAREVEPSVEAADELTRAITQRRSVRAFSERPVPRRVLEEILEVARWAPSGANMQPWEVHVLMGAARRRLSEAMLEAITKGVAAHPDYQYYPTDWFEPYKSRRIGLGMAMYGALRKGGRRESREESWNRNFRFFDAPVGLMFFIQRDLATGSWIDYGMFLQNIMLLAQHRGLATCPQASLSYYPDVVRETLGIAADRLLVCGISLGYRAAEQPVNEFERTRAEVGEFTTFHE